jgi:hypothetical protein
MNIGATLNVALLKDISKYYQSGLGAAFHSRATPHLRPLPINTESVADRPAFPYDDAVAIVCGKSRIALIASAERRSEYPAKSVLIRFRHVCNLTPSPIAT